MIHPDPLDRLLRLQRGAEHPHALGRRATAELLAELSGQIWGLPAILRLLNEYERHMTPEMLRLTGGERFPARTLRVVPR
jgi:hypothetical protein